MLISYQNGQTAIIIRVKLRQSVASTTPGQGLTGLTGSSSGIVISTIADTEASATVYTAAGSTIQTIATLGTYAAPSASNCRFSQVDSTNHPGVYELQFANARFAVSNAKSLLISITGASNLADCDVCVPLTSVNPYDGVHGGMSALPNTACTGSASLLTSGTGTDQISVSSGKMLLQATQTGVTIPTVTTVTNQLTAAAIAAGVWQDATSGDFTVSGSIGKSLFTSGNAPGSSSGLALVGSNMGTVSSVTGSVGSISGITFPAHFSALAITASGIVQADLQTIKTQAVTCAAGVTVGVFVGNGTAALVVDGSGNVTFNNTSIATVTTLTNLPSIPSNWLTAAGINAGALNGKGDWLLAGSYTAPPTTAQIATGVWQDATAGDFTAAGSIGKSLFTSGNAPGAASGLLIAGSNAATTFATLTSTGIFSVNGVSNVAQTGDSYARLGVPAGASIAADLAEIEAETDGIAAIPTNPYTGTPPNTAQIATAVWEDLTVGSDFGTSGSIGKLIVTTGLTVASVTGSVGSISGITFPTYFSSLVIDASGRVDVSRITGAAPSTYIADSVWDELLSNHTSTGSGGAVLASIDTTVSTTGVILADGAITDAKITFPAETAGRPSTFLAAMRRLWEWAVNRRARDRNTGDVVLYGADNSTTLETQVQSTASTTDTQTKGA